MLCPENYPAILGHEPAASNAIADTSDWICLKNARGVLITVMEYTAGGDTDLVLTIHESADGSGTTALAATFPIWVTTDPATSDVAVRQTDAASYTIDATTTKNYVVQMYIPASILSAGCSWVQLGTSGGNAANIASVLYQLDGERYQQGSPLTAIA